MMKKCDMDETENSISEVERKKRCEEEKRRNEKFQNLKRIGNAEFFINLLNMYDYTMQ